MWPENFTQPSDCLDIKCTGRKLCIWVKMQGQSSTHQPFFFFKIQLLATKSDQQGEKCRHRKESSIDEHKIPFLLESEWLLPYLRYNIIFSLWLLFYLKFSYLWEQRLSYQSLYPQHLEHYLAEQTPQKHRLTEWMKILYHIYMKKLNIIFNLQHKDVDIHEPHCTISYRTYMFLPYWQ